MQAEKKNANKNAKKQSKKNSKMTPKANSYSDVTLRPYSYITPSIRTTGIAMLVAIVPQLILLGTSRSFSCLLVILSASCASILADLIYSFMKKQFSFSWLTALVQGLLVGMFIPGAYNPIAVFIITFVTMFLTKYSFGGFAGSWANPIAMTVAVAYFLNMGAYPSFQISLEALRIRNGGLSLVADGTVPLCAFDGAITRFFNNMIFRLFKVQVPEGFISLLWDTGSAIPAFRFNLFTILASLVLFTFEMLDFVIPLCFLFFYGILVRFFGPLVVGGTFGQGDILMAFLTGGTLFGCVFLLQWFGTTPITLWGKITYGLLGGIIAFIVMGPGTSPIGVIYTVLVLNVLSPVIQVFESRQVRRNIEKILVPRIKAMKEVENV